MSDLFHNSDKEWVPHAIHRKETRGRKRLQSTPEQDEEARRAGTFVAIGQNYHIRRPKTQDQIEKCRMYARQAYEKRKEEYAKLRELAGVKVSATRERPELIMCDLCGRTYLPFSSHRRRHENSARHRFIVDFLERQKRDELPESSSSD
jgi:hypothetical protein